MKKRFFVLAAVLCALTVAALPGCSTNTQGDSAAPVFLVGSFGNLLPGFKCVNAQSPVQISTTVVENRLKIPGGGSSSFLDVQVDRYTVVWKRIDGGTTASPTESFGDGFLVPVGGESTNTDFPYMTADSLIRPPLDQLFPFNGGIDRETGRAEIREIGSVTWYGHTLSGQAVASNAATFEIIFTFCASTGRIETKRAQ